MWILFVSWLIFSFTQNICAELEKFKFIKEIERKKVEGKLKGYAALLEKDGEKFILKQAKGPESVTVSNCILEAIGTHIAQSVGVHCNDVKIVPASDPHHKFYKNRPATLHTFAKGQPIIRCQGLKTAKIKQSKRKYPKKPTDTEGQGLTIHIIRNMAIQPVFAPICAVDTFIGNHDRHRGNLFFEESTNTFTAIDFNASGRDNLAAFALKNLTELAQKNTKLEQNILDSIKTYQKTLKKLINLYPSEKLFKNLEKYVSQTKCKDLDKQTAAELNDFYKSYKQFVTASHDCCQKLITVIDKLLNK